MPDTEAHRMVKAGLEVPLEHHEPLQRLRTPELIYENRVAREAIYARGRATRYDPEKWAALVAADKAGDVPPLA